MRRRKKEKTVVCSVARASFTTRHLQDHSRPRAAKNKIYLASNFGRSWTAGSGDTPGLVYLLDSGAFSRGNPGCLEFMLIFRSFLYSSYARLFFFLEEVFKLVYSVRVIDFSPKLLIK